MSIDSSPRIVSSSTSSRGTRPWALAVSAVIGFALGGLVVWWLQPTLPAAPGSLDPGGDQSWAADVEALKQQLAIERRGAQITNRANEDLRTTIGDLEGTVANLRDDVAFYQRLLETGGTEKGLLIFSMDLQPTSDAEVYRYELVLTQNLTKASTVKGAYTVSVRGIRAGNMLNLPASELATGSNPLNRDYEFKFFAEMRGSLRIPGDFSPEVLTVTLNPESGRNVTRAFEWSQLLADSQ